LIQKLKHMPTLDSCEISSFDGLPKRDELMDTKDAQDLMKRIYFEKDRERGVQGTILRTFEELAELSEAISGGKQKDIDGEMADVFAWLCSLANLLNVDLLEALVKKYPNGCSKCGNVPCECEQ